LDKFLKRKTHADEAERLGISSLMAKASKTLQDLESDDALERLRGTIGTQPIGQFLTPAH
jgi:hypothetical protein